MSISARTQVINPRLGTYFSIFAALFAAIFLLSLIFEELRVKAELLQIALFAAPLLLYGAIGAAVASDEPLEFFAAGRRVPAGYTGLLLALSAGGGTFFVCGAGTFFIGGFDALVLMMGGLAGFVLMATLLAPFYRKFGAYTVPSYIGRRFESKPLRIVSAMIAAVPILLVLSAELRVGSKIAVQLTGASPQSAVLLLAGVLAAVLAPGGKRSFTWAGVAQAVAALLALAILTATVATIVTSLPVPQLTHGPLVRNLVRNEVKQGLQMLAVAPFAFDLPGEGLQQLAKPYTAPFGIVGGAGFVLGALMIAAGFAAAPWLLPRAAATPSVYDARKSLGWATVLFGIMMLTISSVAVFLRDAVLDLVSSESAGELPAWASQIASLGLASFDTSTGHLGYANMSFDRDGVIFALPVVAGLPRAYAYLAYAGALAAALLAAGATVIALAAILAEDAVQGLSWDPPPSRSRVWTARTFVVIAAGCGAALALMAPTDPLRLMLWALALTASSLFPILVLSIWWKHLTRSGAMVGLIVGFGVAALSIFAGEAGTIGLPSAIAGSLGFPCAVGAALIVSTLVPETSRHALEIVRDIRVPGGEIIYDREMRRLRIRNQAKP